MNIAPHQKRARATRSRAHRTARLVAAAAPPLLNMAALYEVILLTKAAKDLGGGTEKLKRSSRSARRTSGRGRHPRRHTAVGASVSSHIDPEAAGQPLRRALHLHARLHLAADAAQPREDAAHRRHGAAAVDAQAGEHADARQGGARPKVPRALGKTSRRSDAVDLEADPSEAARWKYRNLVMQRVFGGAQSRS